MADCDDLCHFCCYNSHRLVAVKDLRIHDHTDMSSPPMAASSAARQYSRWHQRFDPDRDALDLQLSRQQRVS